MNEKLYLGLPWVFYDIFLSKTWSNSDIEEAL